MARLSNKRRRRRRCGSIAAVAFLGATVALSGIATAGPDQLKGGTVVLQLQNSRGLKLKPKGLNLPIVSGSVDPVTGAGSVQVNGSFKAKRGKGKTKVTLTRLSLGANGGPGSVSAKVGKKSVGSFATLSGGTVARSGFGATISNIGAKIAGKGAAALNKAFSPKQGKGAKKSAGGAVKVGQPLGTIVSITTEPLAVEVVPGSGMLTLHTALTGAFASKLPQHCIEPLSGGVAPIAPATQSVADFDFPVSGGSAAPDFSAGEVLTAGGQTLAKNSTAPGILTPASCPTADPPNGTALVSTDIGVDFAHNFLNSSAALPTGAILRAPLGDVDFSTGTRSFDSSTSSLTVTGATVSLSLPAALTLNQFFPTQSGNAGDDFVEGDAIGTIDLTGVKLR
jgi:hypothetical protein